MKLVCNKSDWLDDWYVIERADHDGREWFEKIGNNSFSYQTSARLSDACVEGTYAEMQEIAAAIQRHGAASFKRCAVRVEGDTVKFLSPRNSEKAGEAPLSDAMDLAQQILTMKPSGGEQKT